MIRCRQLALAVLIVGNIGGTGSHAFAQMAQLDRQVEAGPAAGQEAEQPELETDRDAFTPATSTVGLERAVVESSYSFIDNRNVAATNSFPELLVRYGITDRIELRLGWNYEVGGAGDVVSGGEGSEGLEGGRIERETQSVYGVKVAVTEQRRWIPRTAAILQGYTPTSGEAPATDVVAAYAFGWELPKKWRLDSSMRYGTEHDIQDAYNQWAPRWCCACRSTTSGTCTPNILASIPKAPRQFQPGLFSPGAHYLLTPNLELGARVGWRITADAANFFSNVGIGCRF